MGQPKKTSTTTTMGTDHREPGDAAAGRRLDRLASRRLTRRRRAPGQGLGIGRYRVNTLMFLAPAILVTGRRRPPPCLGVSEPLEISPVSWAMTLETWT